MIQSFFVWLLGPALAFIFLLLSITLGVIVIDFAIICSIEGLPPALSKYLRERNARK